MDRSAIQAISELAVGAIAANKSGDFSRILAPLIFDGEKFISAEKYLDGRTRLRGTFSTTSLPGFIEYVNDRVDTYAASKGEIGLFVDNVQDKACAIFNLGTRTDPGHADLRAALDLRRTAAFSAVMATDGNRYQQRKLVEFIEDWSDRITAISGDEVVPIASALAAIRSISIDETKRNGNVERDFGATRSAMEDIEARATAGTLPGFLIFKTEPYDGFEVRDIKVRVGIPLAGGDSKLCFSLQVVAREALEEAISREFLAMLRTGIDVAAHQISVGTFNAG
jgi:uncharacterized protein YfdQ (DUF2303 family)